MRDTFIGMRCCCTAGLVFYWIFTISSVGEIDGLNLIKSQPSREYCSATCTAICGCVIPTQCSEISNIELHRGTFAVSGIINSASICWNGTIAVHGTVPIRWLTLIRRWGDRQQTHRHTYTHTSARKYRTQFDCCALCHSFAGCCQDIFLHYMGSYLRTTFCCTNQTKFYYLRNHKLKNSTMDGCVCVCAYERSMGARNDVRREYISLLNWNLHTSETATGAERIHGIHFIIVIMIGGSRFGYTSFQHSFFFACRCQTNLRR